MPAVSLDVVDAAGLGELLQFLDAWLAAGHDQVDASWGRFAGHPAYGVGELRAGLARFIFLLGADDGEALFNPGRQR